LVLTGSAGFAGLAGGAAIVDLTAHL